MFYYAFYIIERHRAWLFRDRALLDFMEIMEEKEIDMKMRRDMEIEKE